MKKILSITSIIAALALVVVSCAREELDTNQYSNDAVMLQAYGPQPVVRGGQLRFIGSNLDKVVSVTIPENNVITDIEVISSGVHSEIRVTVPKETSAPGFPVLTLADGNTITGKTQLTYSEPITIDKYTSSAYPGEDVTIEGDYLNLIHEVVFNNKVKVSETAFKQHTRYKIVVTVPAEAQTGKLQLGTIDELNTADENLLASLNLVETEGEVIIGTATGRVSAAGPYKPGDVVKINGEHLDLVKTLVLEGATLTEFTVNSAKNLLSFALPAVAKDGLITMVMASGVEFQAGEITTAVPGALVVSPAPVKNGAQLTIDGVDLQLVTGVALPKAGNVEFSYASGRIVLTVPEKAQEGDITLSVANGKTTTVAYTLVKPAVTGFSANPAAAGSPVTINGTDLDLVAAVTFGGDIKVTVEDPAADAIIVGVPTAAESGKVVLNLKNGTDIEGLELEISKPEGAYLASVPETVFKVGDIFIAEIVNAEHLQKVLFDNIEVNYLVNSGTLYVGIPEGVKAGTKLHLVSDNGEVVYDINIDPGTQIAWVIWSGSEDMGSWSNQPYVGEFGFLLNHPEVVPGDVIRFTLVGNADWWQIQLIGGNWGDPIAIANAENAPDGIYDIVLTQEIIDKLNALDNWGGLFVVQGENCTLVQISVIHYIPQETVIWEGSEDMGSWSNQPYLAPWGYLADNNVAAGSICRFYITGYADWYQVQIIGGNWGDPITVADANNVVDGHYDFELTQAIVDKLNALDNWGGLFVVQGESCIITKISILQIVK